MSRVTRALAVLAAVSLAAGTAAACATPADPEPTAADAAPAEAAPADVATTAAATTVPDVVGRDLASAHKELAAAGLVTAARGETTSETPTEGRVLSTDPAAGATLARGDTVTVTVRGPAPAATLAGLVSSRPDVFVGLGFRRDKDLIPVVAFGPGADPEAWRTRLDAVAAGEPYEVTECPRTHADLARVAALLSGRPYGSYAIVPDPATCSVELSGDAFTEADRQALWAEFGDAVTVVHATVRRAPR
jgi:hypothetical protein